MYSVSKYYEVPGAAIVCSCLSKLQHLGTIQAECDQVIRYFVADEDKNPIRFGESASLTVSVCVIIASLRVCRFFLWASAMNCAPTKHGLPMWMNDGNPFSRIVGDMANSVVFMSFS
jgi:hypothetical protein